MREFRVGDWVKIKDDVHLYSDNQNKIKRASKIYYIFNIDNDRKYVKYRLSETKENPISTGLFWAAEEIELLKSGNQLEFDF